MASTAHDTHDRAEPREGDHVVDTPRSTHDMPPYPPCACYFSNTAWIISQAMPTGGGEHAPPGSLLMAPPPDANRPFPSTPPVYPWLRRGSNLYGTRRFYLSGTRRFYLDSLAEYRSPNSPLLVPPLLRLGFVGVLISVPVALVIKRAGYTHTHSTQRHREPHHPVGL